MAGINPFKPNYPVATGMFVGRINEISRLKAQLIQTQAGNPANFIITGERGIGKSSLLIFIKYLADGEIKSTDLSANFLVIDIYIDQNTTQIGLIKKIELALNRQLEKTEPARAFLSEVWSFIQRIEAAGIKINPDQKITNPETIIDELSYSIARIVERLCNSSESQNMFGKKYDGILILIDEADNASQSLQLGSFLKHLSECVQRQGCNKLMFGLAGLPELREILMESHPSSIRLFDELSLERLSNEEVNLVIDLALEEAAKLNGINTTITDEARNWLIMLSEGYPHFIQQFGYSAFAADTDNIIDEEDVKKGAFDDLGAMQQIGERYYRNDFYNKVNRDSYREVLRIMADKWDDWVTKDEIRKLFKGKTSVLDNAIKALRDRGIILTKEGEKGVYRLQQKGFALWIKLFTIDPDTFTSSLSELKQEENLLESAESHIITYIKSLPKQDDIKENRKK